MRFLFTPALCAFVFLFLQSTYAQTYVLNWGTSFTPAWNAGQTTGTSGTIGASGATVNVALTSNEISPFTGFTAFTSPVISSGGTPLNTQLTTASPALSVGIKLNANTSFVDIKLTFSKAVSNVTFTISDIDKSNATSVTYLDEVLVTGLNGASPVPNPALSKYNGTAVNTANDTTLINANIATANSVSGKGGNSPSNLTDQNATVNVNFGANNLTSVTVRYRNGAGTQAVPAAQAIAISNVNFQTALALPVVLSNFSLRENSDQKVELSWTTEQEQNSDFFIVERSSDGISFTEVARVPARGNSGSALSYNATDARPLATTAYYRLKLVDKDSKFTYSKVLRFNGNASTNTLQAYPNPFRDQLSVSFNQLTNGTLRLSDVNGKLMKSQRVQSASGLVLNGLTSLSAGTYYLQLLDKAGKVLATQKISKQ